MNITIHSPFRASPRMSRTGFIAVLDRAGSFDSPALWGNFPRMELSEIAGDVYDGIVDEGGDPAVELAVCGREHSFGTNQNSVLWRSYRAGEPTRAWGNQRTVRHPGIQGAGTWHDPERNSAYARFRDVRDSARDAVYRVKDPTFAYRDAVSIVEVLRIWAPVSDDNNPDSFAQYVVDRVNAWSAEFPVEEEPMAAQIPGFVWRPARETHYSRGRSQKIRGYAQHFTAGTNSLGWLTGDSRPPVSSTFLIKHNPTLADRGWQLVRIEDTAWTTAFANPYTVSCEYEHNQQRPVPAIAYTVMAQTILDTAAFVKANGLGEIPLNRQGIRGHKEWVNNPSLLCPDGIDMNKLVAEVERLSKGKEPESNPNELIIGGKRIYGGMKGRYEQLGNLAVATLGMPRTEEFEADVDGVSRRVVVWERAVTGWYPENLPHGVPPSNPMHVRCLTLAEAQDVVMQAMKQGVI